MEALKTHAVKIQIGTIVAVLLFIIGAVWAFADYKASVDNQISTITNQYEHCNKWYDSLQNQVDLLDDQANGRDIILAEIRTQLTSMQITLQEIKQAVK